MIEANCAIIIFLGLFLRWSVSLYPYSGAEKTPLFGDYEAQRHWQEITVNLPVKEWYINSTNNDLMYWGLDYPPLTAYHSYLCGLVAKYINPDYVTFYKSRGYESCDHKLFMRYTVLVMDLLLYIPAVLYATKYQNNVVKSKNGAKSCFAAFILYPGLYLIDYGHFQYNNVSLGLFILAVGCIFQNHDYISVIFFTLALNYKQMELYHALPFFFYLLGSCIEKDFFSGLKKLFIIATFLFSTLIVCWLPFIFNLDLMQQIIKRIFPIGRGLYEDKVANFWCSISILFKLKSMFESSSLALICLIVTALLVLPSGIHLLLRPRLNIFKYSLVNIAFIFFLFSFHVHEKSILLVAIPACLIFNEEPLIVSWFFIISTGSMLPLLIRDGLLIPTLSLSVLTYFLYDFSYKEDTSKYSFSRISLCWIMFCLSVLGLFSLCFICIVFPPPAKYPDFYPVLIAVYSCGHYCFFCVYFHYCQFCCFNYGSTSVKKIKQR